MIAEISNRIRNLKTSRKELRKFSILLCFVLEIIGGFLFWKGNPYWPILAALGVLLLFVGLAMPFILKGFYKIWMSWAFILGWIMTEVILTITFFILITPMGLILKKLLRKDLLDEKMGEKEETYWKRYKPITDKSRYLKRF